MKNLTSRQLLALLLGGLCLVALGLLVFKNPTGLNSTPKTDPNIIISTGVIQDGDTLSTLLIRKSLPPLTIDKIQTTLAKKFDLRRLRGGRAFELVTSTSGLFKEFTYHDDPTHSYTVSRSSMGIFSNTEAKQNTVWMEKRVKGEVTESLYKDLLRQGYDETFVANLVADLADNIFAWRIDFFTEQRPGDSLNLLMEQEFLVGSDKPLWGGGGKILAASYMGKGTRQKENYAIRFTPPGAKQADYFDLDGKAVRKAFLRAPFTHGAFRVSSGFNLRRFHPILRTYRPHHGTDYASPIGTPVASIGKGTVVYAGWKGGYGRCVEIRHSNKFVSRYGHLSRVVVRTGQSINQGQYIGNVGSSGLSTGPHLHFEMLVDGAQRNFLTMTFPSASSVSQDQMAQFNQVRDELLARLNQGQSQVSSAQTKSTQDNN